MLRNCSLFIFSFLLLAMGCTKHRAYTAGIIDVACHNADNSGKVPIASVADTLPAKSYAVIVSYSAVLTGHDDGVDIKGESSYHFAVKPAGVRVYSLSAFDSSHAAGTILNDYFFLVADTASYQPQALSSDYLTPFINFAGKKTDQDTFHCDVYLVMAQAPQVMGPRDFVIDLSLTDSTHYKDTLHITLK